MMMLFGHKKRPVSRLLNLAAIIGSSGDWETISGEYVAFEADAGKKLKKLTVGIEPVQPGSGDPSPENVRPITGWSGSNVFRTGKNLFDVSTYAFTQGKWINASDGSQSNNVAYASTTDFIPFSGLAGAKITLNKRPGGGLPGIAFYAGTAQNTFISGAKNNSGTAGEPMTATVPDGTKYMRFTVPADATDIQIELGESSTSYEAYAGTKYPVTWTGDVYGGELDVTNGVLTVTDANIASYNGEELPSTWISDRDVYAAGTTPTTGAQVVYKLAEPVTQKLTAVEVTTLSGANCLWADTGEVAKCVYPKKV